MSLVKIGLLLDLIGAIVIGLDLLKNEYLVKINDEFKVFNKHPIAGPVKGIKDSVIYVLLVIGLIFIKTKIPQQFDGVHNFIEFLIMTLAGIIMLICAFIVSTFFVIVLIKIIIFLSRPIKNTGLFRNPISVVGVLFLIAGFTLQILGSN